jgi:hypothetical protein
LGIVVWVCLEDMNNAPKLKGRHNDIVMIIASW